MIQDFVVPPLPPRVEIETPEVLKQLVKSHRHLAELKGTVKTIPNENILINTLSLQEAKDSSEIENIVTTLDDLYKENIFIDSHNPATKEVINYAQGLKKGFEIIRKERLLLNKHIIVIQGILEGNNAGFRTQAGTKLVNSQGQVIYVPPQHSDEILDLMANLEKFINDSSFSDLDPLTKMAVIHYQFESIHPFYDGNGRTGRIINILYLVLQGLLDIPVLYLSRFITRNKARYYQVLQEVRTKEAWENMVLYMLQGVEITARQTIDLITDIKFLMQDYKNRMRKQFPKIYSQDLINNLFKNPYTKIEFLQQDLNVSYLTSRRYLELLSDAGYLLKVQVGRSSYYINEPLLKLFTK